MSDTSRQSLTDRAQAALTPDALKSDDQIRREMARGSIDEMQAKLQPDSHKSLLQKTADSLRDLSTHLPFVHHDAPRFDTSQAMPMQSGEGEHHEPTSPHLYIQGHSDTSHMSRLLSTPGTSGPTKTTGRGTLGGEHASDDMQSSDSTSIVPQSGLLATSPAAEGVQHLPKFGEHVSMGAEGPEADEGLVYSIVHKLSGFHPERGTNTKQHG
ncbi:hypothetical protein BCR44DRAFT_1510224 [Catenaria anguillulae PL171]|uniref:Uncharacterized protein n=1 Tax=Catenaria anguillulae PL171 TaxID=765915 RepID=A0A1Y2HXX9_9FUNG|nr:hypothetical protein BCR44DRAFT_1510224 [Catenaria anguillulae PL171]